MAMNIENSKECFVRLWRQLERTRQLLKSQHKRFCIRHILLAWFEADATDDFIWEVCGKTVVDEEQAYGWDELSPVVLDPRRHRELLRAIVATRLGIGMRKVSLKALDEAFSEVYPSCTPINVNKKGKAAQARFPVT